MIGDLDEMSNMPMDLESTHYTGTGWTNVAPSSPFDQDLNTTDDVQLASVGVGVTPDADAALAVSGHGVLPQTWGIAVFNDTGAAFSSTAGNNKALYQGVQLQGV